MGMTLLTTCSWMATHGRGIGWDQLHLVWGDWDPQQPFMRAADRGGGYPAPLQLSYSPTKQFGHKGFELES
jgi:hypothetical protein